MKYFNQRNLATAVCLLGFTTGVAVFRAQADQWDKKTFLTVNEPIQIQDRVLEPGKYVLELVETKMNRHVVRIYNADQTHVIDTVMAIPNYRLEPTGHTRFTFYETPPGTAKAMHAWFYPGDNFGQEFLYPKHLTQLTASVATTPTVAQAPAPLPEPAPVVEEQTQAAIEPAPAPEPVEMAQNTPPPAPVADTTPAPATLPKTATLYPTIGLAGLLSLSLLDSCD